MILPTQKSKAPPGPPLFAPTSENEFINTAGQMAHVYNQAHNTGDPDHPQ